MTRSSVPPGTRSKLLTTSRVLLDPFRWLPRWREQYGDPFTLSAMNGTIVMTGEPEGIQQILADLRWPARGVRRVAAEAAAPLVGRTSILLTAGAAHRRTRKLLAPPFNGARMCKRAGPQG